MDKKSSPLWQARFFHSATQIPQLPNTQVPEIVFAGRSNAGKSSAINLLCQQKRLAFASKTPGRTQMINFFSIGGGHVAQHRNDTIELDKLQGLLVDLPGYGYAKVGLNTKKNWGPFLKEYLVHRAQIAGLVLIMDSRHPVQNLDLTLLELLQHQQKPLLVLLTKADKLNQTQKSEAHTSTQDFFAQSFPSWRGGIQVQLFSTIKRIGIESADAVICRWIAEFDSGLPAL